MTYIHAVVVSAAVMHASALTHNNLDTVSWVYEFITVVPAHILVVVTPNLTINQREHAASGEPHKHRHHQNSPNNVVPKEHEHGVHVDVFNDVPEALHNILNCLLTFALHGKVMVIRKKKLTIL